jgi:3',5'-cyclic AMP phosphodiesterase CpdA
MKIVHFSDPHAGGGAEDFMAYFDKRWVGVFNYRFRRRFQHDLSRLRAAVDYILDTKPDAVVCTGDLTSAGQPGEFAKVLEILKDLRESKIPLLYTPGNHDCYVRRKKCVKAVNDAVEYLSGGLYRFSDMPFSQVINGVEFVLLNTSRPSNLLCSWGFVSRADAAKVAEICSREKSGPRLLLTHYPIFEDHPFLRVRHRLFGEKPLVELLDGGKIDLVLCGHVHKPELRIDDKGRGQCIAGSVTRNASMTEIDVNVDDCSFEFRRISL